MFLKMLCHIAAETLDIGNKPYDLLLSIMSVTDFNQ